MPRCARLRHDDDIACLQRDVLLQALPLTHIAVAKLQHLLSRSRPTHDNDVIRAAKGVNPEARLSACRTFSRGFITNEPGFWTCPMT